jgi:hypothetical protein
MGKLGLAGNLANVLSKHFIKSTGRKTAVKSYATENEK